MSTYQTTWLSKPSGAERVPPTTLAYFRARAQHRLHELILNEFRASGLSQADLARRMGKGTDQLCRWLGAPGNWTVNTISDLLFAMSGGEADYSVAHPLDAPKRNSNAPDWITPVGDTI